MLTEQLVDAKDAMLKTFEELERQSTVLTACADQLQRSHRCWPSRWGWGGFLVCLVYAIFMHSVHHQSHQEQRAMETMMKTQMTVMEQRLTQSEQRIVQLETTPVVKKPWWHRR